MENNNIGDRVADHHHHNAQLLSLLESNQDKLIQTSIEQQDQSSSSHQLNISKTIPMRQRTITIGSNQRTSNLRHHTAKDNNTSTYINPQQKYQTRAAPQIPSNDSIISVQPEQVSKVDTMVKSNYRTAVDRERNNSSSFYSKIKVKSGSGLGV